MCCFGKENKITPLPSDKIIPLCKNCEEKYYDPFKNWTTRVFQFNEFPKKYKKFLEKNQQILQRKIKAVKSNIELNSKIITVMKERQKIQEETIVNYFKSLMKTLEIRKDNLLASLADKYRKILIPYEERRKVELNDLEKIYENRNDSLSYFSKWPCIEKIELGKDKREECKRIPDEKLSLMGNFIIQSSPIIYESLQKCQKIPDPVPLKMPEMFCYAFDQNFEKLIDKLGKETFESIDHLEQKQKEEILELTQNAEIIEEDFQSIDLFKESPCCPIHKLPYAFSDGKKFYCQICLTTQKIFTSKNLVLEYKPERTKNILKKQQEKLVRFQKNLEESEKKFQMTIKEHISSTKKTEKTKVDEQINIENQVSEILSQDYHKLEGDIEKRNLFEEAQMKLKRLEENFQKKFEKLRKKEEENTLLTIFEKIKKNKGVNDFQNEELAALYKQTKKIEKL